MSTLMAVLKQEPKPISQVVPGTPPELEKIINRCLRKDRERRYQHMADMKITLQELKEESDSGTLAGTPPAVRPTRTGLGLGGRCTDCRGDSRRRLALSRGCQKTASRTRSGPSHQLSGF